LHVCMTLHTYMGPACANTATYLRTLKHPIKIPSSRRGRSPCDQRHSHCPFEHMGRVHVFHEPVVPMVYSLINYRHSLAGHQNQLLWVDRSYLPHGCMSS
jgi:hypothetical protein